MMKEKETLHKNAPWALNPKDNIWCPAKFVTCYKSSREDKIKCNINGCPYDISGDDGMFI